MIFAQKKIRFHFYFNGRKANEMENIIINIVFMGNMHDENSIDGIINRGANANIYQGDIYPYIHIQMTSHLFVVCNLSLLLCRSDFLKLKQHHKWTIAKKKFANFRNRLLNPTAQKAEEKKMLFNISVNELKRSRAYQIALW